MKLLNDLKFVISVVQEYAEYNKRYIKTYKEVLTVSLLSSLISTHMNIKNLMIELESVDVLKISDIHLELFITIKYTLMILMHFAVYLTLTTFLLLTWVSYKWHKYERNRVFASLKSSMEEHIRKYELVQTPNNY